jgi:biotin carboxyl carrier protein
MRSKTNVTRAGLFIEPDRTWTTEDIPSDQYLAPIEVMSRGFEDSGIALMETKIRVPKIGTSVIKASIGRWFKRVGDPVSLNEPLVEIETDGTTIEVPASATGVLSAILLTDGKTVKAGELLGTIKEYGSSTKTPGAR